MVGGAGLGKSSFMQQLNNMIISQDKDQLEKGGFEPDFFNHVGVEKIALQEVKSIEKMKKAIMDVINKYSKMSSPPEQIVFLLDGYDEM